MKTIICFGLLLAMIAISCDPKSEKEHDQKSMDHSELHTLPGLDHGLIQSPVNILTSETSNSATHEIKVIEPKKIKAADVVNTGHSVQLDFDPGTIIQFDGIDFHFLQAHFHTPSEHHIDGMTFPMEMHFVCKAPMTDETAEPKYLVVGALFKMGKANKFIESFIDKIPESEHDTSLLNKDPVYISDLLEKGEIFNDFYFYRGSLTTPPYTETVRWVIMKKVLEASPEQIQRINELEGNNARHVQALFSREIENN
jgi:carbonic anhydrase